MDQTVQRQTSDAYRSRYYTVEQIDQRLLAGYYDDAVKAGFTGTMDEYLQNLVKIIQATKDDNIGSLIANKSITGDRIKDGTIDKNKLTQGLIDYIESGTGVPEGGVTGDLIADEAVTKQKLSRDVQGVINDIPSLKNQLAGLLWSSAKFTMSGGKTVHVNTNPNATIEAIFTSSDLTPDIITITRPDKTMETFSNVKEASILDTTSRASGNYTFSGKATVGDKSLTASTILYVRNAVYIGMGASYTSIMINTYKQAATRSVADGSFSGKSPANGSKLFLIVPSDVTAPKATEFKMGGAPVVINTSTITFGGVTYTVFETDESYNQGTELNITW